MDLSFIIVNYNVFKDVLECVKSIHANVSGHIYEVIVVDNNSTERDIEGITTICPGVRLISLASNLGFGSANNEGMRISNGRFIVLLNPDVVILDNSIQALIECLEKNPDVGITAPVIRKPDATVDYYDPFFHSIYSRTLNLFGFPYRMSGRIKKRIYDFFDENIALGKPFSLEQAIGAFMMIRREVYENLGGFDERYFLFEEETDWQYRIRRKGWDIRVIPSAIVIHNHHSSISQLGIAFNMYHRYRSGLIFTNKFCGFMGRNYIRIITVVALTMKYIYYWIISGFRIGKSKTRTEYFIDLLKMALSSKRKVLNSKYVFELPN